MRRQARDRLQPVVWHAARGRSAAETKKETVAAAAEANEETVAAAAETKKGTVAAAAETKKLLQETNRSQKRDETEPQTNPKP